MLFDILFFIAGERKQTVPETEYFFLKSHILDQIIIMTTDLKLPRSIKQKTQTFSINLNALIYIEDSVLIKESEMVEAPLNYLIN